MNNPALTARAYSPADWESRLDVLNRSAIPLVANAINAAIVGAVLWGDVPVNALLGWLAFMAATTAIRFILRHAYLGAARPIAQPQKWLVRHAVGSASTGLLCLVLSWNEAFWSLNLTAAKGGTLATLIASYSSPEGLFWAKLSAASLMAIAPIVVFGWFSQKQLVQGLTFGAVK